MELFLLWRPLGPSDAERVAAGLLRLFAPLFTEKPECAIRRNRAAALVVLHLPVQGWTRPFAEEDEERRVQAIDYPLDATLALDDGRILLRASRELERDPSAFVSQLSPPFSLLCNPDFIRAAFAVPAALKTDHALHQHIIATNTPDWANVPYAEPQPPSRYYDKNALCQTTGASLLNDALRNGVFWTEVFDADVASEDAREVADAFVMLSLLPDGL